MAFSNKIIASSLSPPTPNTTLEGIRKIGIASNNFLQTRKPNSLVYPNLSTAYPETAINDQNTASIPPLDYMDFSHIEQMQKHKEVRNLLLKAEENPLECLIMVDELKRLGIDYHFQEEIKAILSKHYKSFSVNGDESLYNISLCFRLLRQSGYYIPTDVFNRFKDKKGKFNPLLSEDIKGIMGLYEASHLCLPGEHILDEAKDFSESHLQASLMELTDKDLARAVGDTLEHPYHKSLQRFKVKHFFQNFQRGYANGSKRVLWDLANMDFNNVQSLHQRELLEVTQWWKDLGLAQELKFARDQPLKWYVWSMATLTDPKFSEQRIELTKPISLIYIIDDIFDVYGTLDELVLFTEAVNKWDLDAIQELPDYMKICFRALYDISNEISGNVLKKYGWNPIESIRKSWARLCNAFLVEAKWFSSGHIPKAEEYLKNGVISSGVDIVMVHIFFLLGEGINEESVKRVENMPGLITCPATILRLWDDLGSAKDENQEGKDGSYIECYMKDHKHSSIESAQQHTLDMISNSWKQLNEECLLSNPFSPTFKEASLNLARMVRAMYSYDDNQRLPTLEKHIKSLLHEGIHF